MEERDDAAHARELRMVHVGQDVPRLRGEVSGRDDGEPPVHHVGQPGRPEITDESEHRPCRDDRRRRHGLSPCPRWRLRARRQRQHGRRHEEREEVADLPDRPQPVRPSRRHGVRQRDDDRDRTTHAARLPHHVEHRPGTDAARRVSARRRAAASPRRARRGAPRPRGPALRERSARGAMRRRPSRCRAAPGSGARGAAPRRPGAAPRRTPGGSTTSRRVGSRPRPSTAGRLPRNTDAVRGRSAAGQSLRSKTRT